MQATLDAQQLPTLDPRSRREEVHHQLIRLGLVTPAEWKAASEALPPDADLESVLRRLTEASSTWCRDTSQTFPVLTEFQVAQIRTNLADRLRIQHYLILDRAGAGGMGEVFKVRNVNLDRLEALKVFVHDESHGERDTQRRARFEREARLLASLEHPCIPTVYHHGCEGNLWFIAMEYVRGRDMVAIVEDARTRSEPITVRWAVEKIVGVAQALQKAHEEGIVHRDIKPPNIMVTHTGQPMLLDMGIARLMAGEGPANETALTRRGGGQLGTPSFMPPEQWADAALVTPASDVYSLGCTLYFILTGQVPFRATSLFELMKAHAKDPPVPPSRLRPDLSAELDEVILKTLAKRADDRYASATELIEALRPLLIERPAEAPAAPAPADVRLTPPPQRRSWVGATVLAAVLFAAILVVGAWYARHVFIQPANQSQPVALGTRQDPAGEPEASHMRAARVDGAVQAPGPPVPTPGPPAMTDPPRPTPPSATPTTAVTLTPAQRHRQRAGQLREEGRLEDAIAEHLAAAALEPDKAARDREAAAAAYAMLADRAIEHGQFDQAIAALEQALQLDPSRMEDWMARTVATQTKRGESHLARRDWPAAITDFDRVLPLAKDRSAVHHLRGQAYEGLGQRDRALADYVAAARGTTDPAARKRLASLACRLLEDRGLESLLRKDYDAAVADLAISVQLDPNRVDSHRLLSHLYLKHRRNPQSAYESLRALAALEPNEEESHRKLAELILSAGDQVSATIAQAVQHATRACELTHWKDYRPLLVLARCCHAQGRGEEAISHARRALELAPQPARKEVQAFLSSLEKASGS